MLLLDAQLTEVVAFAAATLQSENIKVYSTELEEWQHSPTCDWELLAASAAAAHTEGNQLLLPPPQSFFSDSA